MALSRQEVLHVAQLASLTLEESEVQSLSEQLGAIVDYVAELSQVNTDEVEPTTFLSVEALPFRADTPRKGLTPEQATSGAAQCRGGAFAVPTFVEE